MVGKGWFLAEIRWFHGKNHAVVGKQTDIAVQKIHHYSVREL